ncbi:MAG: hypothetical protein ACSHWW_09175 [Nonlabens sp.]|uniref:hypothetical protein n=1 Tax=Nonlabens sp. TaxID=1888209 RepID=UPI003EF87091
MKKSTLLLAFIAVYALLNSCKETTSKTSATAIEQVTGQVEEYNGDAGQLNIMGYFVEPELDGTIDNDGNIELNLPTDFDKISQKAFEEYNALAESGYELSPIGIEDVFLSLENVEIKGDDVKVALAGKYYGFEIFNNNSEKVGRVFPASSREFIMNIMNGDKNPPVEGYYYMILYSNGNTTITGINKEPLTIDENGEVNLYTQTSYDVNISKGWNIIKYAVSDTIEDDNMEIQIKESAFTSVKRDDFNSNWLYFPL